MVTASAPARTRVPPSNPEAEESVLGALMLSVDAANLAMERLEPGDFYQPAHQAIFEAAAGLYDSSQAIDAITVADALRRSGELDRVGGVAYLTGLINAVPAASNVEYYAGIVEEASLRRKLVQAGASISDLAFESGREIAEVLDRSEQAVFGVAERRIGEGLTPIRPLLTSTLETIEELGVKGSDVTGLPTGFRDLDRKLAGLQAANLVVIAARPSMGKSTLATNIALNAARLQHPVAIFTLEMSREEVVQRLLCGLGRIDSHKLRTGQLADQEWQRVAMAAGELAKCPIFIDDAAYLTVTEVRAKARRLKRKEGLELIVVDYLQLMSAGGRGENRQQEIADISRGLKNLARELSVPIIAVSQLNRALENRTDKRPMLGDLRESGAIEQDSDIVMFIYRDEYYHPENTEALGLAEVNVAKHRAGATGRVDMTFLAEFTLFADLGRDAAL